MTDATLHFVHITDTHISGDPNKNNPEAPHHSSAGARALVAAVNRLPFQPDFILHTGDVAFDPDEDDYRMAREILSQLKAPVYYTPGNHDGTELLQRIVVGVDEPIAPYDYEFEVNGVQIVVVDSHQPVRDDMPYSRLLPQQIERLRAIASADDPRPLLVATHHNVLPIGVPWWDDFMRMQNGEDFHAALLPARERLLGVLHGHVHQQTQTSRDGITYTSGLSSWFQLDCLPGQEGTVFDVHPAVGFEVVYVSGGQMFIRQQTFGL